MGVEQAGAVDICLSRDGVEQIADGVARKGRDEDARPQSAAPARLYVTEDQPGEEMGLAGPRRAEDQPGALLDQTKPGLDLRRPQRIVVVTCQSRNSKVLQGLAPDVRIVRQPTKGLRVTEERQDLATDCHAIRIPDKR
ncbi:hypothetical protein FHT80_006367 [Rhizobium sp. BK226]|nr:hypothetical protein [Rhizobium sp. BK226]MBB4116986.1 hypothetical protein [Rhizobium sp. BK226]